MDSSLGCKTDDDCVRMEKSCCNLGEYIAVTKDNAAAYQASLGCEAVSCPVTTVVDDHSVAECNVEKHVCEVVLPRDVACNGLTTNPHACPEGWRCRLHIADVPGSCIQTCGGFANLQCSNTTEHCVDDPDDSCDPRHGGADCSGICVATGD